MAQNPERDVPTLSATVNWFDWGKRFVFMSFNDSRNGFAPCQYFKKLFSKLCCCWRLNLGKSPHNRTWHIGS